MALEKRQQFKSIGIIGRLGGNLCKEDYDNDVALGMHLSLGTQFPVYKKLSMNLMIDYNFIVEKIGYYVTCDYSRHQSLLAGKTVHWGGPMIKAGLSYSVFRK